MQWDGSCLAHNDPRWSTLKYLYKWLSIKIPLYISFALLACFLLSLYYICSLQIKRFQFTIRTPWVFLLSQLCLLPVLAIMGSSNLYGAERHLLFIFPPLAILTVASFESLFGNPNRIKSLLAFSICLLFLISICDTLLIHPFQIAYFNEVARLPRATLNLGPFQLKTYPHDHLLTATEYWGSSTRELAKKYKDAKLLEKKPLASTSDGSHNPPFIQAFSQERGMISKSSPNRLILLNGGHPNWWSDYKNCRLSVDVSRRQLFSAPVLMSKLYECPASDEQ